jgi:hypothetical protein
VPGERKRIRAGQDRTSHGGAERMGPKSGQSLPTPTIVPEKQRTPPVTNKLGHQLTAAEPPLPKRPGQDRKSTGRLHSFHGFLQRFAVPEVARTGGMGQEGQNFEAFRRHNLPPREQPELPLRFQVPHPDRPAIRLRFDTPTWVPEVCERLENIVMAIFGQTEAKIEAILGSQTAKISEGGAERAREVKTFVKMDMGIDQSDPGHRRYLRTNADRIGTARPSRINTVSLVPPEATRARSR